MALYSWNGTLLPVQGLPKVSTYYVSNYLVYRYDGTVYAIGLDWIGGYLFRATVDKKNFWLYQGGYRWTLVDGQWTNRETAQKYVKNENGQYQNAYPVDEFIWTSQTVYSWNAPDLNSWKETVLIKGDMNDESKIGKPISEYTLEPLPRARLVASHGETGVIVGAQIRNKTADEVIDISDEVQYEVEVDAASCGCCIDENRQLIVDPSLPGDSFSIEITWSELSGKSARIDVVVASNNSSDSSTITGIAASETVLELIPGASCPLTVTVDGTEDYNPTVLYHAFENDIYWDGSTIYVGENVSWVDGYIVFYSQQDPSYNVEVLVSVKELKPCYLKENGEWVKKTAYERIDSKWVKISDASRPPSYVFVEYLQSNGNSYFSTDIVPNAETEVEMQYSVQELLSLGTHMLSCENWYCPFPRKSIFLASRNGNELEITPAPVVNTIYTVRTYLDGTISINGADYGPLTAGTKTPTKPLYMCTYGGNPGSSSYAGECRVYYCKIRQAGVLVRDYIPAVNKNGVAGMYDKVTKTFYRSIGEDFEAPT